MGPCVTGSSVRGLILSDEGVLLVQNRRRNGSHDWTPPGGVIEEGETAPRGAHPGGRGGDRPAGRASGRARSTRCAARRPTWAGTCGSRSHLALSYEGELRIDDPDGIVVDARFVDVDACGEMVAGGHPWVCEPLGEWLAERWHHGDTRPYGFHVAGALPDEVVVTRA